MMDSTNTPVPSSPRENPGWNFCLPIEVRFRDIDMFLHVNNAAYLTYAESARVAYFTHVTGIENPRDFDMTLARAQVDFLKPIFFPTTLHVYARATRIGTKSWDLDYEVRDAATNDLFATISTVLVYFEHETGQSKPLTPELISLIETHEGRNLRA